MRILTLAWWYEADARVKQRFDTWTKRPFKRLPPHGGEAWLARQVSLALAPAFLLAPLATYALYPWLPQPEWWLYEATGMMLFGVAGVAHIEYKRAQPARDVLSVTPGAGALVAHPPPAGRMASSPEATPRPASHRTARFEINLRGKEHVLETNLDLLKTRTLCHRKGDNIVWDFTGVRAIIEEDGAEVVVTDTLSVMDVERRWRIVEAQLEDLERQGFLLRKRA